MKTVEIANCNTHIHDKNIVSQLVNFSLLIISFVTNTKWRGVEHGVLVSVTELFRYGKVAPLTNSTSFPIMSYAAVNEF
jgi:hypothetical protein